MEAGTEKPLAQKRMTALGEKARRKQIFVLPRSSWTYDRFAREKRLKPKRVHEIVSKVLQRPEIDDASDYALVQLLRLASAQRAAGEAVADGNVSAIALL